MSGETKRGCIWTILLWLVCIVGSLILIFSIGGCGPVLTFSKNIDYTKPRVDCGGYHGRPMQHSSHRQSRNVR